MITGFYNKLIFTLGIVLTLLLLSSCRSKNESVMVGTLERDRIELKVESNEPISGLFVRDGKFVDSGELILEQDPARARARRDQQAALLDQARARLAELERGPRQESIRESRARLEGLQSQTVNAAADLSRAQDVFDAGLSNQAELDRAQTAWKSTQAQETAARESLAALLHGTTPEELQQAAAAVSANEAMLAQAEIDLERTRIRAPVPGIIDKQLFQLGERPPAGSTVAVLLDSSRVFARIYVPADLRARVVPGERLSVQIDGISGTISGTVRWVSSDASFTPYFALTEHDRSRLSYLAEIDLDGAAGLPSGIPLTVYPPGSETP
jgi:HlyD family secretion protein